MLAPFRSIGESMDEKDLIYIAAFWEGEGHAGIYSQSLHKKLALLEVGIDQKDPLVLYWIKDVTGYGNIRKDNRGCGLFRWRVKGKKAKKFLTVIYPYLKFRKQQIGVLI